MKLILEIAAGVLLANLAWELLGTAMHSAGRIVARQVIEKARRVASATEQPEQK